MGTGGPDDHRTSPGLAASARRAHRAAGNETEQLLRRLASADERSLQTTLSPARAPRAALDRNTRALVQLSALLAVGAATVSLRWAVDVASAAGVDDAALVRVLLIGAGAVGAAQTVSNAPRLALAMGLDVDEAWEAG